jgi:hypothetical protein
MKFYSCMESALLIPMQPALDDDDGLCSMTFQFPHGATGLSKRPDELARVQIKQLDTTIGATTEHMFAIDLEARHRVIMGGDPVLAFKRRQVPKP